MSSDRWTVRPSWLRSVRSLGVTWLIPTSVLEGGENPITRSELTRRLRALLSGGGSASLAAWWLLAPSASPDARPGPGPLGGKDTGRNSLHECEQHGQNLPVLGSPSRACCRPAGEVGRWAGQRDGERGGTRVPEAPGRVFTGHLAASLLPQRPAWW